ncbi:hypothetical protein DV515_00003544 [Chloebia gouldiae]|uniref:Uncharacterized protein n=1 Tax=Chloebia gouldiae TaxID=44316 RepID=A0A3L8ST34_CHLGU|nr:hypothetical protein DV515_00003544 [Chloebia gouldiae]
MCATSPALGRRCSRVPAPEPRSSRIQTSRFIPGPPSRSWWSEGCLQAPGGERGEARARRGLSHAFTHSSRRAFVTPGPAKEGYKVQLHRTASLHRAAQSTEMKILAQKTEPCVQLHCPATPDLLALRSPHGQRQMGKRRFPTLSGL